MELVIDTSKPFSEIDLEIIAVLLDNLPEATGAPTEPPEPSSGTSAPASAPRPSETPREAQETPSGPDQALLDQAIRRATGLIKADRGGEVKTALDKTGKAKVTELKDDESLRTFLAELPEES